MQDEKYPSPSGPEVVVAGSSKTLTDTEVLREVFKYHAPSGYQNDAYDAIRAAAHSLALTIYNFAPKCADRTAAIRKVREAVMTANAAIALHGLV